MSNGEWIALGGFLLVFLGAIFSSIKFFVRSIMRELLPNSGKSLRDELRVVSSRVDQIYLLIAEKD